MSETHDYTTVTLKAEALNSTHVLVGESGGLSAVYNVYPCQSAALRDHLAVETEHGTLYIDSEDEVQVLVH